MERIGWRHEADSCRYDFEYEDDDEEEGGDVHIENRYYNAKQLKADDEAAAIDEFLLVPELEEQKGDWCVQTSSHFSAS